MSPLFGRRQDATSPRRQPRGLRRQAERAKRREAARRSDRRSLDLQQLEPRLAMAIAVNQNFDTTTPYALITSDAGDKMYMSNLGNGTYAVADNSQFLDSGAFERHDMLEMQRIKQIIVTDVKSVDTTATGQRVRLAQASYQEFGLPHGGLFWGQRTFGTYPMTGRLYNGSSFFDFTVTDGGSLNFGGKAGAPVSGVVDPGDPNGSRSISFGGVGADSNLFWDSARNAVIRIDWGAGVTPDNAYITNLNYAFNLPGWRGWNDDGGPSWRDYSWTQFSDQNGKVFPGVPTGTPSYSLTQAQQDSLRQFSLQPNIVGGSIGTALLDANDDGQADVGSDGLPINKVGVLHFDNYPDVYFKSIDTREGANIPLALSRDKNGPFRYVGQSAIVNGVTVQNPSREWVFLAPIDSARSQATIAVSATVNTITGKLEVKAYRSNAALSELDQAEFNTATGQGFAGWIYPDQVNPGHVSVDINYKSYAAFKDDNGDEQSSSFTVYDGHDVTQRLRVDLVGSKSKIHIDSPVLSSHRIELRGSDIRIDAPTQAVVDPNDPALNSKNKDADARVTSGMLVVGGSLYNPATTARYVNVNAAVSAETGYEITLAAAPVDRGYLYVSPTGSLAGSLLTPQTTPTQLAIVDALSADIVVEGVVNADKHTYMMRSSASDTNRHFFTTTSKFTGMPTGTVRGGTASVLLGNSTDGLVQLPGDSTYIPTYVTLQTDLQNLRVRAAHSNAVGPTSPLQYEMKISEANDITIDAIAASGFPITLAAQGEMLFKASVETLSDLTIQVAKRFAVSAPLSSLAGNISITAGTDLIVNNNVRAFGTANNAEEGYPRVTLTAGANYASAGPSQNGGALKVSSLAEAIGGTVVLQAFGDRSKNSADNAAVRQGTIYGNSRVKGQKLVVDADNTISLGTDVGVITGAAAAGINVTQDIDLNAYPVLAYQALTLDKLTTEFGNISVTAGANITLKDVVAGAEGQGVGDVLISSTGIRSRPSGSLTEVVAEGTNITLAADGVVMALNDRVRLHAPTGEIFGTSAPVASWLDWTATAVPEAEGLYENIERLSAYLKSGKTSANLAINTPAGVTLEEIKTDNGNIVVAAGGAITARSVQAGGTASEISLETKAAGAITIGSLAASARVEVTSATGILAAAGGGKIAGLSASTPLGEAVLRAQADVGKTSQRIVVNADKLTITDNEIGDPQNVFVTLTASRTELDIEAATAIDVNSSALFNDVKVSNLAIGQNGSVSIQATRNIDVAGAIGSADARAKIVSLAATSGALKWSDGGQVASETVALTAMRELGDADKYEDVFGDVETFRLARTGQGDIRANFSRQSAVKLDGVSTTGGSVHIANTISDGVADEAAIFVASKGITAGGGGSVMLEASGRIVSGVIGTPARGVVRSGGRVSLRAGSLIDVTTAAPLLWANTTGEGSTISIAATGDVTIAASRDGSPVAPGRAAGIVAGSPEGGVIDGTVALNVLGKLSTEKNAWVSAATASVIARSGIGVNVDVSGPVSATTSSGDLGLISKGSLLVGSGGVNAPGGNVSITAAIESDIASDPETGRPLPAVSQEDESVFGITGRNVHVAVTKAGAIDVKTSATALSASTSDGDIWIAERDNAAIGTAGIVAKVGDVYLSARGGFTTQQVPGVSAGRVSGKNVEISVGNLLAVSTAADVLTVNSVRGDVQIAEQDAVELKVNAQAGAVDVSAGGKVTVQQVNTNGSRSAVSITAGPATSGGVIQGTRDIVLSLTEDPNTGEPVTPINAAGSVVTLRGSTITQNDDSRASVVASGLSLNASGGGGGVAIALTAASNAISASAPVGSIDITHAGAASTPLVLGAAINGAPAAIRAGGNVTIRSTTSDVVVAAAPIAGKTGKVSIEAEPENRSVTFIVTTNADTTTGGVAVAGSLRSTLSLMSANVNEDRQGIAFSNAITAPIAVSRPLDVIARRTDIDGTRRFITSSNQFINASGTPIVIDGSSIKGSAPANGLEFGVNTVAETTASGSTVTGLAIQGFRTGAGIKLTNVSDVTIQGNTLGFVRSSGPVAGNRFGVHVTSVNGSSNGNRIISNSIGSNLMAGVFVENAGTTNTLVQRNQIGTTSARLARGNANYGVHVLNAGAGTTIGDASSGTPAQTSGNGNLFMFNGLATNKSLAAAFVDGTDGVVVGGNEFTLNVGRGLHLRNSDQADIRNNTFMRNGEDAIVIEASEEASVARNFIGTDRFRTLGQGNEGAGLRVLNGRGHAVHGNSIANNKGVGIELSGSSANTIGGTTAAQRNTISGNLTGVVVSNGGTGSVTAILGNTISNNALHGVEIASTTRVQVSDGNVIELNGTRRDGGSGVTIRNAAIATIFGNAIRGNGNTADDKKGFAIDGIRRETTAVVVPRPVITTARRVTNQNGLTLTATFTAAGMGGATVWVDLYQSEAAGQGSRYLGRQQVTLNNGTGTVSITPIGGFAANTSFVMTVTNAAGHTSSFSAPRLVT